MDEPVHLCPRCHFRVEPGQDRCAACLGVRPPEGWPIDARLGQTILGSIVLIRRIGSGATGSIYLGEDQGTGQRIAVKILHPELCGDSDLCKRFQVEAVVTKSLNIPQVVRTFDFGELEDGSRYLTMEFVDGQNLDRLLIERGALPLGIALEVVRQILAALGVAHSRCVVHRDLKPGNIILTRDDSDNPLVKILDFGFAKLATESQGFQPPVRLTRGNVILGTPLYMSPEQARALPVDGRTDLYSLGVMFYRMVTGVPPFTADSPIEIIQKHLKEKPKPPSSRSPGLPPALDRIILRMLEKDPDRRYPSAETVLQDLDAEFPTGAFRWDVGRLGTEAIGRSELLEQVGRYVDRSRTLGGGLSPSRSLSPLLFFFAGAGAAGLIAAILWLVLR